MPIALLVKVEVVEEQSKLINSLIQRANIDESFYSVRNDHHCTSLFASKYARLPENTYTAPFMHTARVVDVAILGKDAIVCLLEDNEKVMHRNQQSLARAFGARPDHDVYVPHVTIAYSRDNLITPQHLQDLAKQFVGIQFSFDRQKFTTFSQ